MPSRPSPLPDVSPEALPAAASVMRAVAFDLDGTLVDSAPDIAHALNEALREAGFGGVALAQVRQWIGDGPDALIERALTALRQSGRAAQPARTQPHLPQPHGPRAHRPQPHLRVLRLAFDRATLRAPLAHGAVFDGVPALLQRLRLARPLAVVTNKPTRLARAVLDAAGILPFFAAVHGADTAALRKPAPALLQRVAAELGVAPHELLMVGDSAADIAAAAAAGAPAAFAAWGYGAAHALPAEPRWRIERPGELIALLDGAA